MKIKNLSLLFKPGLIKAFQAEYRKVPKRYPNFFFVNTMNNRIKNVTERNMWHIIETYEDRPARVVMEAVIMILKSMKRRK